MKLDDLNNAFIDYGNQSMLNRYFRYFREVERQLGRKFTKSEITDIIERVPIDIDTRPKVIQALVLSDLQDVIIAKRQRRRIDTVKYALAIGLVAKYKKPETIVNYVSKQTSLLNDNKGTEVFKKFVGAKRTVITRTSVGLNREMMKINKYIKSELSKSILQDYDKLQDEGLTPDEIRDQLNEKFDDNRARVDRIVKTEGHAILEKTKLLASEGKFKTWQTQGDDRVRDTGFHHGVERQKVKIDETFKVGGISAQFPSDYSLPVQERINCRCYLTFSDE